MGAPRWVIAAGAAGLITAGILLRAGGAPRPTRTGGEPEKPAISAHIDRRSTHEAPPAEADRGDEPAAPGLPRSLEGTEVDGSLDAGPDGHLVLGPRVIQLFDYFFQATGEEPESVLAGRIAAHARQHLSEPALGEALALLDHYRAYREAGRTLSITASATPEERLRAVHDLRRAHFGDAADALFGDDERSASAAIERSRVAKDESLSPEDRADRLAEIDAGLPASERLARSQAMSVAQLRDDEAALRAAGADEAEIHRFRAGTLGDEAAARLDTLDRDRAAWKDRLDAFRRERESRCHSPEDKACETALLRSSFDEREQIRVRAILSFTAN